MSKDKDLKWITVNGAHIPIKEGQTAEEAKKEFFAKQNKSSTWDGEKKKLPTKKVVKVKLDASIQKEFDNATPKERQEIAFKYIMDNLRGKYPAEDGRTVAIERVGADKMSHSYNEIKIKVLPELKELIEAGRLRGVIDVNHKLFTQMAYYDVDFKIGEEQYKSRLNVGIRKNGDSTLYDINPIEKAKK